MIVVDASTLIELLLRTPAARSIEQRLFDPTESLHAPHVVDVEVVHVIRRLAAKEELAQDRSQTMIALLAQLPLRRYPHEPLLPRIWDLRHSLTAYDAAYVALAEALQAPLLTRDRRLAAAHGHDATIEVV